MTEPSLALQAALRTRFVASGALAALVPAASIVDASKAPETFPTIRIGEAQTIAGPGLTRNRHEIFADVHVWTQEAGLVLAKQIVGEMRTALADGLWTVPGFAVADLYISNVRFLRDPDGLHGHAVVTVTAQVMETA